MQACAFVEFQEETSYQIATKMRSIKYKNKFLRIEKRLNTNAINNNVNNNLSKKDTIKNINISYNNNNHNNDHSKGKERKV